MVCGVGPTVFKILVSGIYCSLESTICISHLVVHPHVYQVYDVCVSRGDLQITI